MVQVIWQMEADGVSKAGGVSVVCIRSVGWAKDGSCGICREVLICDEGCICRILEIKPMELMGNIGM